MTASNTRFGVRIGDGARLPGSTAPPPEDPPPAGQLALADPDLFPLADLDGARLMEPA